MTREAPSAYLQAASQRVVVFDGAMGTQLMALDLSAADFGGERYLGCNEALLHGNDIALGFGLSLEPPRDMCRRVLARLYPQAPSELGGTDPWTSLLWAGGRIELPDHATPQWRPHPAPLTS